VISIAGFLGILSSSAVLSSSNTQISGTLISQSSSPEPSFEASPSVAPDKQEEIEEPASTEPVPPPDSLDNTEIEALDSKVLEIGKRFGKVDPNTHLATFDAKEAKKAGYDTETIQLVEEQVDFQNSLIDALKSGKTKMGDKNFRPSAQKHKKLKRFHYRAHERIKKLRNKKASENSIKLASLNGNNLFAVNTETACGNYSYPKPNVTPTRYFYNQINPPALDWLTKNGFHKTASYATGNYGNNYTRQTSYSGVQGTCDSPKFRDDGTVEATTKMNIQYKEPNPEVLELYYGPWPYLGWADYVKWWHDTH
jgi:hypothetical protein